jgi:outer membrane protein assembly factor BamB
MEKTPVRRSSEFVRCAGRRGLGAALVVLTLWSSVRADTADQIIEKTARKKGLCAVLGGDGQIALALAEKSGFLVYYRADNRGTAAALIARPDAAKLLNDRLYVDFGAITAVPFADNALDLLVLPKGQKTVAASEIERALNPDGALALAGADGVEVKTGLKPFPPEMDGWTHWFHGPDNNPVSSDMALKWPYLTQWLAGPHRGPQPGIGVVSHGRYFAAAGFNHNWGTAEAERMAPYRSMLTAFNAFNGTVLWTRKLAGNNPVARSGLIADRDTLYLMEGDGVYVLDAETGRELKVIRPHGEGVELKWMARDGDVLFVLGGDKDEEIKPPARWGALDKYVLAMVDEKGVRHWGFSTRLAAYDLKAGKPLWKVEEPATIDARLISLGGGKLFYFAQDTRLVALDVETGKMVWENRSPELVADLTEPSAAFGHSGLQVPRPGLLYSPDALLINTKGKKNLLAVSPSDGRRLWASPVRGAPAHTFCFNGKLYVDGIGMVDAATGKATGKFTCSGTGCGPIVASPNGFYGRHGIGFDLVRSLPVDDNSSRGGCWQNCFPANGLLFMSPYLCGCPYILRGYIVVGSAGNFDFNRKADKASRLELVKTDVPVTENAAPEDWPAYRAGNERAASTPVKVAATAGQQWVFTGGVAALPTPPVAAGDRIYYCDERGMVYAVSRTDGKPVWTCRTGGAIKASPTLWKGRVFVGSGDGCVYALNAEDGSLLWRFRAGPAERRIMAFDQMVSTWPVNSGVLIHEGVAYFGAGIVDRDGTYIYALDAKTGDIRWQNTESGHLEKDMHKGASLNGYFALSSNRLWMASGNAYSPVGYDLADGSTIVPDYASSSVYDPVRRGRDIGVFLNDYVVHGGYPLFSSQNEWLTGGKGDKYAFTEIQADGTLKFPELEVMTVALLPAWDKRSVLTSFSEKRLHGVEIWDSEKTLAFIRTELAKTTDVNKKFLEQPSGKIKKASFVSTMEGRGQNAVAPDYEMKRWKNPPLGCIYSVVLAGNAALVVWGDGASDGIQTKWTLTAMNREDGKELWKISLPSEPVLNGLCVTRDGDLALTLTDGRLLLVGAEHEQAKN